MAGAGELTAKIVLGGLDAVEKQLNNFSKAMSKVGKQASTMGSNLRDAGQGFNELGENIAPLSAGLLAIGGASVVATDNINSAINNFQTKLGATGAELAEYEGVMQEVANTGVGSFDEVSNAVIDLSHNMKGLSPAEMTTLTEEAMQLASVMGSDVSQVSKTAGIMMKQFGIDGSTAMDLIAKGYQNGMDYAGDYQDTLSEYSVYFSQLGYDADDMFNTLITGAEAGAFNLDKVGDAVKEFGIRSKDGSDASKEAFEALGMDAEKMTQIFAKGGEGAKESYGEVVNALAGVDDQAKRNAIGVALFGTQYEDMEADVIASTGSITDHMGDIEGTAGNVAEANKTFAQEMQGYWNEIQVAIEPVGDTIRDFISSVMPPLISGIKTLAEGFNGLSPTMQKVVLAFGAFIGFLPVLLVGIGGFLSVLGTMSAGVGALSKGFGMVAKAGTFLIKSFKMIGTVIKVLFKFLKVNPWMLLITGLIIVATAIYQNWDTIVAKTKEIFSALSAWFSPYWNSFKEIVATVVQGIISKWQEFKVIFMSVMSGIGSFFSSVWSGLVAVAQTVWTGLVTGLTFCFELIKTVIQTAWTVIKTIFLVALGILVTLLAPLWNAFANGWNLMVSIVQTVLAKIKSWLGSAITFMGELWNKYKAVVSAIWSAVYSTVIAPVVAKIKSIVNTLISKAKQVMNSVKATFSSVWNAIYSSVIKPVIDKVKSIIETVVGKAKTVMNNVKSAFSTAWNAIKSVVSTVISGIVTTIQKILSKAKSVGDSVKSALSGAFNSVKSTVSSAISTITGKVESIWTKAKGVADKIKKAFSNLFSGIKIPSFSMGGWTYKDLPKLPKMKVQWNASGGILDSATMIGAGEKGAEAIVPLSSQRRMKPFAQAVSKFMPEGAGKSGGDTNIHVAQLIVREEADVTKIAQELNKLQERKDRARGGISFA